MTNTPTSVPMPFHRKSLSSEARPFFVMLKPRGSICNLECTYCYFLSKKDLYPGSSFRMNGEMLEEFTRQYIESHPHRAEFSWQGGEPTLMGLEFFERAVELQKQYAPPGTIVTNTLQTNGTLLDDAWCEFFASNDFLVGLSIDGPPRLHDHYRVDKAGRPSFDRVMQGLEHIKRHRVEFNVLTTVHAANQSHGAEVYQFLRDDVGAQFIQFIPIVERENAGDNLLTDRSTTGPAYGQFLVDVFDEWVRRDVGTVYVQIFDVALAAWSGDDPGLCVFEPTCGTGLAMEHNGDLYSCDHYVEPNYFLGSIRSQPLDELVSSPAQVAFGDAKLATLPRQCLECDVRFVCNGGCPKNRVAVTPDGELGLNHLCAGYMQFFGHIRLPMEYMATQLRARRPPAGVMRLMAVLDAGPSGTERNDPCPCGSGVKFKNCRHWDQTNQTPEMG